MAKKGEAVTVLPLLQFAQRTAEVSSAVSSPSSDGRMRDGGRSPIFVGLVAMRLIQTVRKPNFVAPAMSQRLDDWNETASGIEPPAGGHEVVDRRVGLEAPDDVDGEDLVEDLVERGRPDRRLPASRASRWRGSRGGRRRPSAPSARPALPGSSRASSRRRAVRRAGSCRRRAPWRSAKSSACSVSCQKST